MRCSCFGYLHKMSSHGIKQWQRRWFVLKESGLLLYYKSAKDSTHSEAGALQA